ncbi:hypothetical protein EPUS_07702 [Endocarpon pusillum Z07020]|uniref:Uncharacterized protein n=1 Tax=Endocarpon pusillum (strain Z07020 / HMAS-L-300199) TaxID=1263415 RepID=U1GJY7_ENDPU|nr:uncharacterized protein EPUS_07702 [Endocarpon pusillum Z07020]ERF72493.1 hypothetical protein EPUS_07702 [Endocarpon pusillum Z07020]
MHFFQSLLSAAVLILSTNAASCGIQPKGDIQPKVASGWQGSGIYQIINVASKTGIDLLHGGDQIVGYRANLESQNQVWKISLVSVDGACGSFAIQNNRTLDAITSNGVPQRISATKFTSHKTQLWNIKIQESGSVVFENIAYPCNYIDLYRGQTGNEVPIYSYPKRSEPNQQWDLIPLGPKPTADDIVNGHLGQLTINVEL